MFKIHTIIRNTSLIPKKNAAPFKFEQSSQSYTLNAAVYDGFAVKRISVPKRLST